MTEHTELPWFVGKDYYGGISIRTILKQATNITGENAIFENTGRGSGDISIEDAEFIVLACNSHKKLLKACERAHDALLSLHVCNQDNSFAGEIRTLLKAAITAATD